MSGYGWKAKGTAKCAVCGREFSKNARNQKVCGPECRKEQDKRNRAKRAREEGGGECTGS